MSWDNQVAAEQSRRVTSGNQLKKILKSDKASFKLSDNPKSVKFFK